MLVTFDRGLGFFSRLSNTETEVLLTRIDSDDCYAPDAITLVKANQGERMASQFTGGFIYSVDDQQAWRMRHYSPPVYTLRLRIDSHGLHTPPHEGHNAVRDTFNALILPDDKFCMLRHGKQSSRFALGDRIGVNFGPGTDAWEQLMTNFPLSNQAAFWRERDCPGIHQLLGLD